MTSPDPKYFNKRKQRKLYLENFGKRFRMILREEDEKYPDAKIHPMYILDVVTKILAEKITKG